MLAPADGLPALRLGGRRRGERGFEPRPRGRREPIQDAGHRRPGYGCVRGFRAGVRRGTAAGTVEAWNSSGGSERPHSRRPVLIAAFEGWNDAGDAAPRRVPLPRRGLGRARGSPPSTPRSSTTSRHPARRCAWPTASPARSSGRRTSCRPPTCPGRTRDVIVPRRARAAAEVAHVLRRDPRRGQGARRRDGRDPRRPAGRHPAHPPGAGHGHGRRPRAGQRAAPPALALRGADRHRRRAARRPVRRASPSASLWAAVPHYVAPDAVAQGGARSRGAHRPSCSRPPSP